MLRIPDSYDAKIVKICNLWTFWPVIQLICPLFKIRQKALLPNTPKVRFLHLWSIGQKGFLSEFEKMVY